MKRVTVTLLAALMVASCYSEISAGASSTASAQVSVTVISNPLKLSFPEGDSLVLIQSPMTGSVLITIENKTGEMITVTSEILSGFTSINYKMLFKEFSCTDMEGTLFITYVGN